jgi:hypothetical protein
MQRRWKAAAMAVVLGRAGGTGAHEFTCDKRVQVKGEWEGTNVHPKGESVADLVEDPLLGRHGFGSPFPMRGGGVAGAGAGPARHGSAPHHPSLACR